MNYTDERFRWHILLTVISCSCFLNSLENGFVHDDIFAIKNNDDIKTESPLSNIFQNDFWGKDLRDDKSHKSYRPLCILTFKLNYLLHGLQPFGYHFVNLLLHVAAVNLFFYMLYTIIFHKVVVSGVAALIFATHPIHVEAVTGVVGRADVLSCILFLLSFYYYTRHLQKVDIEKKIHISFFTSEFILTLLYGSMCLFTKEHAVTVFFVCIAYDVIRRKHIFLQYLPSNATKNKVSSLSHNELMSFIKRILFIMVWVVMLFLFRVQIMGNKLPPFKEEDNPASFSPHLLTRVLTYMYLITFNAQLLLAPYILCYDWQVGSIPLIESVYDVRNVYTLAFVLTMAFLVAGALFTAEQSYDHEITLLGISFLVIPFIPASNFFLRVGFVVAERILYIPSLGFCILVALGMNKLLTHASKRITYFTYGVIIVLFCIKTIKYNTVWKSRESLFKSGVETLPHNAKVHYNYANFLSDHQRKDEAIYHYQQAVRFYPSHSSAHNNLGTLLKDTKLANHHFLEAIKYTPGHYRAMFNLASLYRNEDRNDDAEAMLRRALGLNPKYFDAQFTLAQVLQENKKYDEANSMFKMLYNKDKLNHDLLHKYAEFLLEINQIKESLSLYDQLLKIDSKSFITNHNIAKAYRQNKQIEKAKEYFEKAISINPTDTAGYQSLAGFLFQEKDLLGAKNVYERMARYSKPVQDHTRNYAVILFSLKEHDKAIKMIEDLIDQDKYYKNGYYTMVNFMVEVNPAKAYTVIDQCLQIFPGDLEILLQLANLKRNEKLYDEAKKIYLEVLSTQPENFHALINVGTIYHIEKDLTKAEKYYLLAQRLNPNDSALVQNIQKLKRLQQKNQ